MLKNVLVVLVCAGGLSAAAMGDSVTLAPSKDNTLFQDPNGELSNGAGPNVFVGTTLQNSKRRAVLQWDLSSIPSGATITGVSLTMYMAQSNGPVSNVTLQRTLGSWGEGTSNSGITGGSGAAATAGDATWLHRNYSSLMWATAGGDFSAVVSGSQSVDGVGFYTWTDAQMVADVQDWLSNPSTNNGWLMLGNERELATAKRFASREATNSAQRPALTVEYVVPAPGTVVGLAGLGVVMGRRRRK